MKLRLTLSWWSMALDRTRSRYEWSPGRGLRRTHTVATLAEALEVERGL